MGDADGIIAQSFEMVQISDEDARRANEELDRRGVAGLKRFLESKLNDWKKVHLNIGVTGAAGTGKSTIINTMRGLVPGDPGAAKVAVTECTVYPTPYRHPDHEGFTIWDLPGVGTPRFLRGDYLVKVGFERFDFFFIVCSGRFTENDLWLAREIQRRNKRFFFIRSKLDEDMTNDKEDNPGGHSEQRVLDAIQKDCQKNLGDLASHHVFLLSGKKMYSTLWDFPRLTQCLIDSIPDLKKHALVLSLTANSREIIEQKCQALAIRIWIVAAASAAVAAVPVPGLSIAVDIAILVGEITTYKRQLGLDEQTIRSLSREHGIPTDQLESSITVSMPSQILREVPTYVTKLLQTMVVGTAAEELSRFIPVVGAVIASGISFTTTVLVLKKALADLEEAAVRVLERIISRSRDGI